MDKNQAKALIQETFNDSFDRSRFIKFVKELLNEIDEGKAQSWNKQYVKHDFHDGVKKYERIGTYTAPEGEKIDILVVYLEKDFTLERARTLQRNFVAYHLKKRAEKEAGLVAFVSPNGEDWRFSLVKMEYHLEQTNEGKVKAEEEITPAKRCSFVVGKNENSHTAQKQLLPILEDDKNNPTLKEIEKAFSIETVTKEFFNKYKDIFLNFKDEFDKILEKDKKITVDFSGKGINTADFAKKLLGQIVFLYFLQRKGWLGVDKNEHWGSGPKNFLRALFDKKYADYKNFFNDILEPLFYEALATDRGEKAYYSRFDCRIPFLNGGLFEPIQNYDWENTDIIIPNDLFSNDFKTKEGDVGSGILDFFDRYNFTIKEDEPLEKEVAIDPEMLGKVFENLLEVKDRKSKGAYYTPREIVHYMCQESLINYLTTESEGKVPREEIETFIHLGDFAVEHDMAKTQGIIKDDGKYKLPQSIHENAELIDKKLADITVCDPAIGSGAFPVGMMNEIVRARGALNATKTFKDAKSKRTPYSFKRHAIQNSLYGVDIDPGAVEIAKLRLWLSLVVDEEEMAEIKPLPNLDYKIMQGNSLLEEYEGIKLFDESLLGVKKGLKDATQMTIGDFEGKQGEARKKLEKLHEQFFESSQRTDKKEIKKQIDELEWELIEETLKEHGKEKELPKLQALRRSNNKPFFLWKLHFAEVFLKKGGFDVVIANPPYAGERKHKDIFHEVQKGNLSKFYFGRMDFFYFFFHLALELGKEKSHHAFISTNYFITALGARKLRADLKHRSVIQNLVNFNELKIFDSASGQHNMITLFEKNQNYDEIARTCITHRKGVANDSLMSDIVTGCDNQSEYHKIKQEQLFEGDEQYIRLNGCLDFKDDVIQNILKKMQKNTGDVTLKDVCNPIIGLESSADSIFIIKNEDIKKIVKNSTERFYFKPFFKNSDIQRYYFRNKSHNSILYLHEKIFENIGNLPGIWNYLKKNERVLKNRKGANLRGAFRRGNWWVLNTPRLNLNFEKPKILTPYRTKKCNFAYCETPWYASRDVYYITEKDMRLSLKFILALLNSKLYYIWLYNKGKRKGDTLELYQKPLSEIPIKIISPTEQKPFISLVDSIISVTTSDDYDPHNPPQKQRDLEKEIDKLVYKLYGLTSKEIQIIEKSLSQ